MVTARLFSGADAPDRIAHAKSQQEIERGRQTFEPSSHVSKFFRGNVLEQRTKIVFLRRTTLFPFCNVSSSRENAVLWQRGNCGRREKDGRKVKYVIKFVQIQGTVKEWSLGCVNPAS